MIFDASELPDDKPLEADVCIVGAGAAGITMALELAGSELDVVLLESGAHTDEKDIQSLYEGSVTDDRLHNLPDRYRRRRFGGSTTIWGGRCTPLDEIDFKRRDYIPFSGWPIERSALLPYYPKANRLCEAGDFVYTAAESLSSASRPMINGFHSADFSTETLERFSCPTDFGARYGHKLRAAKNVRLVLHGSATKLQLNAAGNHLERVAVATLRGKQFTVRARCFVLAVGGLEVPRLLLASRDVRPAGIGNEHDVVGRYYMCHLAGTIGRLRINGPLDSVWNGYDITDDGVYCRRRFALLAKAQEQHRIGNFIARLHHPRIADPEHRNAVLSLLYVAQILIPYEYRKRLQEADQPTVRKWLRHVRNIITYPHDATAFAWHMFNDRFLAARKFPSIIVKSKTNVFSLDFHAEQVPNPMSRITLTAARDALGLPRLNVDWRYLPDDVRTVGASIALLARDFQHSGIGQLDYDPGTVELEMTRYGAYGGHHIGTTRMGLDPRTSVVDPDCQVHGVDNLYVTGSAVFPTSSQANPTLTIVALALRLAAHLTVKAHARS